MIKKTFWRNLKAKLKFRAFIIFVRNFQLIYVGMLSKICRAYCLTKYCRNFLARLLFNPRRRWSPMSTSSSPGNRLAKDFVKRCTLSRWRLGRCHVVRHVVLVL